VRTRLFSPANVSTSHVRPTVRNAYLLINYGDFRDGTTDKDAPFVQALATTDPVSAHTDFVRARLAGVDSTGLQTLLNAPATVPTPTPDTNDETKSWFARHWVVIAIAGASTAAGLLALALVACCLQRRHRAKAPAYRTLAAPAPMPAADMAHVQGYSAGRAFAPGHNMGNSLSVPAYVPAHSRELSDTSTLLESGYEADKFGKDDYVPQYANPWDRQHAAQ
jgi:hypothetical protein